jgi:hypothetical protein
MNDKPQFLLVEPVAKTQYPPLGLMKISTMLKQKYHDCQIFTAIGKDIPQGLYNPEEIYITSLFTWDLNSVVDSILFCQMFFPDAKIWVGGIGASLMPEYIFEKTGIMPHIGLLDGAENCPPDYSLTFGRKLRSSITYTTRGCVRRCEFCCVPKIEPKYCNRNWEQDINPDFPEITIWDNNFLASRNFEDDCKTLLKFGKKVDFNQGLDARLYNERRASILHQVNVSPVRFAFDSMEYSDDVLRAISMAKKITNKEIRVYALYNFKDAPDDFFQRINSINLAGVWAFPMCYREPSIENIQKPNGKWTKELLRGLKVILLNFYTHGMITPPRDSFVKIFGSNTEEFKERLYSSYLYDKSLNSLRSKVSPEEHLQVEMFV